MKEFKETTYVVEGHNNLQLESFNFDTLSEAQSFTDQCLEDQRYNRIELFKEQHTRRRLSSSVATGPPH